MLGFPEARANAQQTDPVAKPHALHNLSERMTANAMLALVKGKRAEISNVQVTRLYCVQEQLW